MKNIWRRSFAGLSAVTDNNEDEDWPKIIVVEDWGYDRVELFYGYEDSIVEYALSAARWDGH